MGIISHVFQKPNCHVHTAAVSAVRSVIGFCRLCIVLFILHRMWSESSAHLSAAALRRARVDPFPCDLLVKTPTIITHQTQYFFIYGPLRQYSQKLCAVGSAGSQNSP